MLTNMGINKKKKKMRIISKSPRVKDLSIGRATLIPNQRATAIPIKKTVVAIGWWKGFWNLLTFSRKGTINNPAGTAAIKITPNNLLGIVRSIWKTRKKIPFR